MKTGGDEALSVSGLGDRSRKKGSGGEEEENHNEKGPSSALCLHWR